MQFRRQPAGLAAEDQHDARRLAERRIPEPSRGLRREEIRFAEFRQLALERLPIRPDAEVDVLPVVEPRSFDFTFVEREAERLDEVQGRVDSQAGTTGVPGVPVNLRMDEDDVYQIEQKRRLAVGRPSPNNSRPRRHESTKNSRTKRPSCLSCLRSMPVAAESRSTHIVVT